MRRIPAFFVLATFALILTGCAKNDSGSMNTNAPGTTTYSNSSAPSTTTAAPSGGGAAAAPKASPTAPGIKPPTDK